MNATELPRTDDGQLSAYAWPGGYPLAYYAEDAGPYCPECANQEDAEPPIVAAEVNWEDSEMHCDGCGKRIPAAYGEDDPTLRDRR